jgi:FkbM family methyltransferase
MVSTLTKVWRIYQRDGFYFTFKRAVAFLIAHTPFADRLSFSYTDNTRLHFAPTLLTYSIFANKKIRSSDVDLIKKYTPTGGTLLDVGGNIGSITIALAEHVGPTGVIHIFEPSPKFFNIIKKNIALNNFSNIVSAHQVALGAKSGTVFLNESVADDTTNHVAAEGTAVSQATLDSFTTSLPHIDFLKIDVEGYELEVLKGATETLNKTQTLYIEFIPSQLERCGSDPQEVLAILNTHFTIHTMGTDGLAPFTYQSTDTNHPDLLCLNKTNSTYA